MKEVYRNSSYLFIIICLISMIPVKHISFRKTQVKLTNTSNFYRTIRLWGGNSAFELCHMANDTLDELEVQETITGISGAKSLVFNPYNELIYVLGNSNIVKLYTTSAVFVGNLLLPVGSLPSAIAVQDLPYSPNYGKVYVSSIGTNIVTVVNTDLTFGPTIPVGLSPQDIAIDGQRERLFVSNAASASISVIGMVTNTIVQTIAVGLPEELAVNPVNGDLYVARNDNSILIYDSNYNIITGHLLGNTKITAITYHPINKRMYIATGVAEFLTPIDTQTYSLLPLITLPAAPNGMVFNPNNNLLIVTTSDDRYLGYDVNEQLISDVSLHAISGGLTLAETNNVLWTSDSASNSVFKVGYPVCNDVLIDSDYLEKVEFFKYNPVLVYGIRWVFSSSNQFKTLSLYKEHSTGTVVKRTLAMENYRSIKHVLPVSDISGVGEIIIDGQHSWEFEIAPLQVITILVYYHQIQRTG